MAEKIKITVPDLGDFSDVEIIEVLVGGGDTVAKEDGLITLETDKAAMDVPAPEDGRIESLTVEVGDTVSSGDVIGEMTVGADGNGDGERDGESDKDSKNDKDSESDEDGGDEKDGNGRRDSGRDEDSDGEADGEPAGDDDKDKKGSDGSQKAADKGGESKPEDATDEGSQSSAGGEQTVRVPDIGDFSDVDVIEVHVAEGDTVEVDDPLITLETDKAAMDVPSTVAGRIGKMLVESGDQVSEGDEIAVVETAGAGDTDAGTGEDQAEPDADSGEAGDSDGGEDKKSAADSSPPADEKTRSADQKQRPTEKQAPGERREPEKGARVSSGLPPIDEAGFSRAHAGPSVRKLARELGVDLARVEGSGPKDRILHEDVKAFVKSILEGRSGAGEGDGDGKGAAALPAVPKVDFAKFGEVDEQPLTRIQKISGPRLQASWVNLPHVTQHDLADITELEQRRQELKGPAKEKGISLTPLAFIMKACIAALQEFPKVNASLSPAGDTLVYKKYYHLGFAADTEGGLVVPVIRDADRMDVYELASALGELSKAAREGKLKAEQIQGASFTISSLGGIGGTAFTPIVNAPEVAILGVSRASMQPVWDGEAFKPRLMLPLSFSYDHRVVDGADAVRFTTFLGEALGDVDQLLRAIP